jgi:hypothetical protein
VRSKVRTRKPLFRIARNVTTREGTGRLSVTWVSQKTYPQFRVPDFGFEDKPGVAIDVITPDFKMQSGVFY